MLQHFYDEFMTFVPMQLPKLLDVTKVEEVRYDDYILLTFPLKNASTIEEVMDTFEDDIQLIMLYHHIPSRQTDYGRSCCAYSNPSFGMMFKMNASKPTWMPCRAAPPNSPTRHAVTRRLSTPVWTVSSKTPCSKRWSTSTAARWPRSPRSIGNCSTTRSSSRSANRERT